MSPEKELDGSTASIWTTGDRRRRNHDDVRPLTPALNFCQSMCSEHNNSFKPSNPSKLAVKISALGDHKVGSFALPFDRLIPHCIQM